MRLLPQYQARCTTVTTMKSRPLLLLLLVLLASLGDYFATRAAIQHVSVSLGNKQLRLMYDTDIASPRFIKTHETTSAIYMVGISPTRERASADRVLCKTSFATQVLIGPKGCDDTEYPELAVEANNCARDEEEAARNRLVTETSFWLESGSSACIANGGDEMSCLGPLWLVTPNSNFPLDNRDITPHDLINAQGVALVTGFGPRCEGPLVTWIDLIMPTVHISNSTCQDLLGISFNDSAFSPYYRDATDINANVTDNDTMVFARESVATHQRMSFQRVDMDDTTAATHRLTLYTTTHYGKLHTSLETFDPRQWLRGGIPVTASFDSGCNATFTLRAVANSTTSADSSGQSLLTLRPPQVLNDLNYYYNQFPSHYYHSSECNYRVGMLDELGRLKYPFLREGEIGGGEWVFKTPGVVGKPIHVDPDPSFADYDIDSCDPFYPRSQPFCPYRFSANDSDCAVPQSPYLADTGLCFAPFLDPETIQKREGIKEARFLDCYKQGGYVYGSSQDRCFRPVQRTLCKRGWIYYHQHCYYKFDADREVGFKTTDSLAEEVCRRVHPMAQTIKSITSDVKLFLKDRFVFWKRQPGHPYRINLGARQCFALDIQTNATSVGDEEDVSIEYPMSCDSVAAFPVCRHHIKDVPIPHQELTLSPNTIRTLRDGQDGVPHIGKEIACKCYPGWTRRDCAAASCPPPPLSANTNNTLLKFFAKCYANGRGSCQDRNPRLCQCFEGYGPPAHWTGNHSDHPCACPAVVPRDPQTTALTNGYVINQVFYPAPSVLTPLICGGLERGACLVESGLNVGVCQCTERLNLDPDAQQKIEKAWDSTHCTAPVPMLPADLRLMNGDIVERLCNAHGTACPSGERYDEQRLDETSLTLLGRDVCRERSSSSSSQSIRLKSGCVCDDGWSGAACTCPVPENVLLPLLTPAVDTAASLMNRAYASLRTRARVRTVVNLDATTCDIVSVQVEDRPVGPRVECTLQAVPRTRGTVEWTCPESAGPVTKVYIQTAESNVLYCTIKAFEQTFSPCGNHPLPWAGSFYRNEFYRSFTTYQLPQSSEFAPYGCTLSECMCQAGYTGPLCALGVSAMRMDWDKMGYHQEVCGMTTLPVRGRPSERPGLSGGGGCECHRVEGLFGEAKFSGRACEEVMVNVDGEWLPCSGRGKNLPARFPTGRCEYDVLDQEQDSLKTPFFGLNPAIDDQASYTFRVVARGNETDLIPSSTVAVLNGEFWELFPGTVLYIPSLHATRSNSNNNNTMVTFRDQVGRVPVNVSYACVGATNSTALPRRVNVFGEFWSLGYVCDENGNSCSANRTDKQTRALNASLIYERCRPEWGDAELNYTEALDLDSEYECLHRTTDWEPIEGNEETLESGFYQDAVLYNGQVELIDTVTYRERSFALGVFDCSNPIDRVLADVAFVLGLGDVRQCSSERIRDHSDVNGAWYGIFEGVIPGLRFEHDKQWSDEEVEFVASLLNFEVCVAEENEDIYIHEAFDGRVLDEISKTWASDVEAESNATVTESLQLPYVYLNTSIYTDGTVMPSALPHSYTPVTEYLTLVPVLPGQYIRQLYISVSFDGLQSLRVFGPTGRLCFTTFTERSFAVNTTFIVDCMFGLDEVEDNGFLPAEKEWDVLLRIRAESGGNLTLANETIAQYYNANGSSSLSDNIQLVWTHERFETFTAWNESFRTEDVRIVSRRRAYSGLFTQLKQQILTQYRFPNHTVYRDQCLMRPRTKIRDFDAARDLDYLRALHLTHLSARRCSSTSQCKKFARNQEHYQCVFDLDYAQMWRGGDPAASSEPFIGDEGGCLCTEGFTDAQFHCSSCVHGYGPNEAVEWTRFREQAVVMANLTNTAVQELPHQTYCAFPYDPLSLRENKICGGRGDLVVDEYESNVTVRVFRETNETRRCLQLVLVTDGGAEEETVDLVIDEEVDYDLRVMRYTGPWSTVTVLNDRVFLNHTTELEYQQADPHTLTTSTGITVRCVPLDNSPTHAMGPLDGIDEWMDSRRSFFLSKILFS